MLSVGYDLRRDKPYVVSLSDEFGNALHVWVTTADLSVYAKALLDMASIAELFAKDFAGVDWVSPDVSKRTA